MTLLRDLMLADLERGLAIARDGHEVVPAWRILAPDGDFLILTQFDPDKPEQRERAFALVPRFMAWKLATGFVLTAETWLGPERTRSGEEAVLTMGVSHHERMAVIRRIRRTPALEFAPAEWLPADALDDTYFRLPPFGQTTVTAEEAAMLRAIFAEDGELPARSASGLANWPHFIKTTIAACRSTDPPPSRPPKSRPPKSRPPTGC